MFSGVVLCISGIEDVHRREEINRLVTKEGGTYVKNIERPVKVTHLLCSTGLDEISEKMKYAEKFNSRKEANISMVWEDWLWDCFSAHGPPLSPQLGLVVHVEQADWMKSCTLSRILDLHREQPKNVRS